MEWWTDTIRYDAGDLGYVMLQLPKYNCRRLAMVTCSLN